VGREVGLVTDERWEAYTAKQVTTLGQLRDQDLVAAARSRPFSAEVCKAAAGITQTDMCVSELTCFCRRASMLRNRGWPPLVCQRPVSWLLQLQQ
jgi:hypothetical protein